MSAPPRSLALLPLLLLPACLPDDSGILDAITDSWSTSTLEIAEPAISAALLVAGVTAELCRADIATDDWEALGTGDTLPLSAELEAALGAPLIDQISTDGNVQVTLEGVRIIDRDNAFLRFTVASSPDAYALNVDVLDGRNDVPFGQLRLSIDQGCDGVVPGAVWVAGEARWTDLSGLTHTINLPADDGLSIGLNIDCGFIPNAGTLSWQGSIEGQTRAIETSDAAEITLYASDGTSEPDEDDVLCERIVGRSEARWPGTVRGGGGEWSVSSELTVPILSP